MAARKSPSKKKLVSPDELEFIAGRFKLLAEPMRLRILHTLQNGERSVSDIIEATGATQANVSKHLGVGRRRKAQNVYYSITDPLMLPPSSFSALINASLPQSNRIA